MAMKYFLLMILVWATTAVVSCSARPNIILYNHSGQALMIYTKVEELRVGKESSLTMRSPTDPTLRITSRQAVWEYQLTYIPREYLRHGAFRDWYCLQIEPNGLIYVLKPEVTPPVQELPVQPPGFPLTPVVQPATG